MQSDFTQGDYTYLDEHGSVDPMAAELEALHAAMVSTGRRRKQTESTDGCQRNTKTSNRRRNKQARKSRRRNSSRS